MKLKTCKIGTKLVSNHTILKNWCSDGETGTIRDEDDMSK